MAKKQETDNVTKVDLSAKKETDDNVIKVDLNNPPKKRRRCRSRAKHR